MEMYGVKGAISSW